MQPAEYEQMLHDAEVKLARLKALYEQYFQGIEKLEPTVPRKELDRVLDILRKTQPRNTALRFRMQMLLAKYGTYQTYWQRIARQIEEGTYRRDVVRAQQRRLHERAQARRQQSEGPSAWELDVDVELPEVESAKDALAFDDSDVEAILGSLGERRSTPAPATPTRRPLSPFAAASGGAPGGSSPPWPPSTAQAPTPNADPPPAGRPVGTFGKPIATFARPAAIKPPPASPQPAPPPTPTVAPPSSTQPKAPHHTQPKAPEQPATAPSTAARPWAAQPTPPQPAGAPPTAHPTSARPTSAQPCAHHSTAQPARPPTIAQPPGAPSIAHRAPAPPTPGTPRPPAPSPPPAGARPAPPPPAAPAAPPRPAPTPAAPDDARLRTIFENYVEARRRNNERVDNVKFETVAQSVRQMIPKLREKHGNRPIDFEVVVQNGKVGLKPKVGG